MPPSIWLVEDNPDDVYLVEKTLAHQKVSCELTRFTDGESVIRHLSNLQTLPDLILIDLKLPRRDGVEVLTAIRATPSLVGVPVCILTSSDAPFDRHRVMLQGVTRYIVKPAAYDGFLKEVGAAIAEMLQP